MVDLHSRSSHDLLDEGRLRQISRSIRSCIPAKDQVDTESLNELRCLFDNVLFVCADSGITPPHRVAAWNVLCSLIDQSLAARQPAVASTIWEYRIWERAFVIYINHAQNARPKSSRQLVSTLASGLQHATGAILPDLKTNTVQRLLASLEDYEEPYKAKASAQLLGSLLTKDVVTIDQLFAGSVAGEEGLLSMRQSLQTLLRKLLLWLSEGDFGSTVSQLVMVLLDGYDNAMSTHADQFADHGVVIWSEPLQAALKHQVTNVDDLRAHILPVLFKRKFSDFVRFLHDIGLESITTTAQDSQSADEPESTSIYDDGLLCASLQTGKELGLLLETDATVTEQTATTVSIPIYALERMLTRQSRNMRLTAFTFLIASPNATRPLEVASLKLIKRSLGIFFADVDADFRSDVFSNFQRLVDRLRSVTAALTRQVQNSTAKTEDNKSSEVLLKHHRQFLEWLVQFLEWELRPTASYQRHISALKCFAILVKSGLDARVQPRDFSKAASGDTRWPFDIPTYSTVSQRCLLELLLDPFDDVRQLAASLLTIYSSFTEIQASEQFRAAVGLALSDGETAMLATGRADHADGVAHLYALCYRSAGSESSAASMGTAPASGVLDQLLSRLVTILESAKHGLAQMVDVYPLHGLLTSLRYILSKCDTDLVVYTQNRDRLVTSLDQVWQIAKPILCGDAPEGSQSEEVGDELVLNNEILSYSWRALKESSLLMSLLISKLKDESSLLHLANLCFQQLAELRHRGAFSTVAQTWTSCCILYGDRKISGTEKTLLARWYQDILDMLENNVTINTRRSGGLPSLLCGILIADKSGSMLVQAFEDLRGIAISPIDAAAAEQGSLAQVHAMNCIKDVLKNTRLGEQSERFVAPSLRLAADALRSDVWDMRNCGLMLFRAVIDRLLGTSEAHFDDVIILHKRISTEQHPEVLEIVLDLLSPVGKDSSPTRYEGVFPALQLLQHARIHISNLERVSTAVRHLTTSPSWHVRDKAARAYASLTDINNAALEAAVAIEARAPGHNALHGALLCARYCVAQLRVTPARHDTARNQNLARPQDSHLSDLEDLATLVMDFYTVALCPTVKAACVDVLTEVLRSSAHMSGATYTSGEALGSLISFLLDAITEQCAAVTNSTDAPALRQAYMRFAAHSMRCEPETNVSKLQTILLQLAQIDSDAVLSFLEELHEANLLRDSVVLAQRLCFELLDTDIPTIVKCAAQHALLSLNIASQDAQLPDTSMLASVEIRNVNQHFVDQDLELRAIYLEASYRSETADGPILAHLMADWIRCCVEGVSEKGLHSREAAARSLRRVTSLTWKTVATITETRSFFSHLCFSVYDLLNDDDEDMRIMASQIACQLLAVISTPGQHDLDMEPIMASQKLLLSCLRQFKDDQVAFSLAYKRAFADSCTVGDRLAQLSQLDGALFAQEKQNLYIDEANEIRVWSRYLTKVSPRAIDKMLIGKLGPWVIDGSAVLAPTTQAIASRAEVFALGLMVIYGAEVLLHMPHSILSVRPSDLRARLIAWLTQVERGQGHILWKRELERVITDSLRLKLGNVNHALEGVLVNTEHGL